MAAHADVAREVDRVVGLLRSLQAQQAQENRSHDHGTVQSYNPTDHTATVALARGGLSGHIPVETIRGIAPAYKRGDQVRVILEQGQPISVAGFVHDARNAPPSADMALEGPIYLGGTVTLGRPLFLGAVVVLPPPNADLRYALCVLSGDTATADILYICLQSATGTYSWIALGHG